MPTVLEAFGLRFFFYSDEHTPVHVHVVKGDGSAKIELMPDVRIVRNDGLKKKDTARALALAKMFREEILAKWEEYFS